MSSTLPAPRLFILGEVFALLVLFSAAPAEGQAFAVGAAGSVVTTTETLASPGSFDTVGGHLFGEMELEPNVIFQVRAGRFGIPGTVEAAPNRRVDSALAHVAYEVKAEWFESRLFGGVGYYRVVPRNATDGQAPVDRTENVFGWHGGLAAIFGLGTSWDLRLEASAHVLRTDETVKPILVTVGVGYRF